MWIRETLWGGCSLNLFLLKMKDQTDLLHILAVLTLYVCVYMHVRVCAQVCVCVYLCAQHMGIHCRASVNQLPLCPGLQANHLSPSSKCPQGWKKKSLHTDYASSKQNQQGWHWPKDSAGLQFSTLPCCGLPFVLSYTLMRADLWPAVRLSSLLY